MDVPISKLNIEACEVVAVSAGGHSIKVRDAGAEDRAYWYILDADLDVPKVGDRVLMHTTSAAPLNVHQIEVINVPEKRSRVRRSAGASGAPDTSGGDPD